MNTQVFGSYYISPTHWPSYWYLIKSDDGKFDVESIQNKPFTSMQLNDALFNNSNETHYEIWNIDGIFGVYDQNLELVKAYKDMNAFMQAYWNGEWHSEEKENLFPEFNFN